MRADDVPERRADQRGEARHHVVLAVHRDAHRVAHRAARAVGGHDVAGVDRAQRAGRDVAQLDARAVRADPDAGHRDAELDARAVLRAQVAEQQRLDVVLRDARRRDRAEDAALRRAGIPDLDRRSGRGPGERLGLEHRRVDVRGAAGAHRVLEAPAAHELHRAQAQHGRAGMRRRRRPALDQQHGHRMARQLDRGGQAGGTGADHQDGDVIVGEHASSLHARPPARLSNGYSTGARSIRLRPCRCPLPAAKPSSG